MNTKFISIFIVFAVIYTNKIECMFSKELKPQQALSHSSIVNISLPRTKQKKITQHITFSKKIEKRIRKYENN